MSMPWIIAIIIRYVNMIYQLSSLTDCRSHITFIHIHMDCINVNTCSLVGMLI